MAKGAKSRTEMRYHMKRCILTILFVSILLLFTSCSRNTTSINATQARLALLLSLQNGDYKLMNDQLSEQGTITEEEFEALREKASDSNTVRKFQLLSFDNGEAFLLEFTQSPNTGEYKIKNITVLSDDLKNFFEEK